MIVTDSILIGEVDEMPTRLKATLAEISKALNLTAGAQQIGMLERNLLFGKGPGERHLDQAPAPGIRSLSQSRLGLRLPSSQRF
jgi:hypothetical protein